MNGNTKYIKSVTVMLLFVFCFSFQSANAQQTKSPAATHVLSGLVRDAYTKKPISAAQVQTLNGSASASTNENGVFKLNLTSLKTLLKVSAYDYNLKEFSTQGKDSVVVELYSESFSNYYKLIEGTNGSLENILSVPSVKDISKINNATVTTADELIQNELGADVRAITRSGVTGMGSSLFIRGLNSVNANAQPLFVVDGVVWSGFSPVESIHKGFISNPLAYIDINDIENISVLKDGTSLYGSKAANGVIVIKTKRGKDNVTKINLNIITGVTEKPKGLPVMDANNYKTYLTDIIGTTDMTNEEISKLPYLNDNPARSIYNIYHNNTNWADQVYQSGVTKSYSINVNGGDDKALYYFTLGYVGNDGVVKSTNMNRYNMRLNSDIKVSNIIKLAANVGFSRIDRVLVDDGVDNYTSPTWLSLTKSPFLSPYNYTAGGVSTTEFTYADILEKGNPGGIIENSNNTAKLNSFNVTLKPTFQLSKDFVLSEQFDYNLNKTSEDYYRPYLFTAPITMLGIGKSQNERRSQVMRNNSLFSDTRLSYSKQIDNSNKLNIFLGTRYIVNSFESDYVEGHNSMSNSSVNLTGSFKNLKADGVNNQTKSLSHYLNVDYNFEDRYFLSGTMSIDGSSRFGSNTTEGFSLFGQSWGVFPSINGAWLISSEGFMKSVPAINLLKLRAGYGVTGNDGIQDYLTETYLSSIRFRDVANGMILSNLKNPKIQWETTGRANLGLDMGLFNDRLNLAVDVYSGVTNNLLMMRQLQDVAGLYSYWSNSGKLSNQGVEFTASAKIVNTTNFHWEFGVSVGHYKNKILELPADIYGSSTAGLTNGSFTTKVYDGEVLTSVGNPAGVFYGYKTLGVFATAKDAADAGLKIVNNDGSYSYFKAGDVIFNDYDGNKIIDAKDKQIIGNPNPDLYGTISNQFNYKKFTLSALIAYSYGNDVYNYQRSMLEAGVDYSNQSTIMMSRWTTEGQVTAQPKAVFGDPMGNARFSDRWIEDGSYIRLKTLSLAYNLPIKSNFIESVNVWVSANNVFTLTKYLGVDPEFSTQNSVLYQGVDAGLVPQTRSYFLGIRLSL
jgi:TonB-linked SusC/RagA family outer membrane protein